MKPVRTIVLICAAMMVGGAAYGQYYPGMRGDTRKSDKSLPSVLPSFPGTVRGRSDKSLAVEVKDENTMMFLLSKKTAWLDGDKKIKPADVKEGDLVIVEAKKEPDGSMAAVTVRLQKPNP